MTADAAGQDLAQQTEQAGAALAAKAEAESRAAFDKAVKAAGLNVESDEPDEEPDEPVKKNTSKARPPQGADEEADEAEETTAEAADDGDGDDEGDEEDVETDDESDEDDVDGSSTDYERALRLLKLKHFTADDLKSLSRKRVIEIAAKIRQDEAVLTKKLEARASNDKASDKAAERSDAGDRQESGAPKGLRAHATRLSKVFDDEAAGAIVETLEGAASEFNSEYGAKFDAINEKVDELMQLNTALRLENFRARIQRRTPEHAEALDDDRLWGRMVKRMNALKDTGEYKSADDLAKDVLDQILKDRNKQQQSHRDRDRGSQRAPTNRATPPKPMTVTDLQRQVFEASLDGDKAKLKRLESARTQ